MTKVIAAMNTKPLEPAARSAGQLLYTYFEAEKAGVSRAPALVTQMR